MKCLELKNEKHIRLEVAFREWLEMTGYAACSVYGMPLHVREFLHYLEQNKKSLETLTPPDIGQYLDYLKHRSRQRRPGCLALNHLHRHLQALKKFSQYLRQTEQGGFDVDVALPPRPAHHQVVLTQEEIGRLYEACAQSCIGQRDRAMLSVFYGCGLRKNEGVALDTDDFCPERNLLYVRKGKNERQRYVPLTERAKNDLLHYLQEGRRAYISRAEERAFFLSRYGTRIQGQSLQKRLKKLLRKSGVNKQIGLHALRHSIATHLLHRGVKLHHISCFLGHSSLESTQHYTHLAANILERVDAEK